MGKIRRTRLFVGLSLAIAAVASAGTAEAASFNCMVKDVMVHGNRIHVQCTRPTLDGASSICYFAVPTSEVTRADRLITIGTTALVAGRRFIAIYTSGDTKGTTFGCLASDCRRLISFGIE